MANARSPRISLCMIARDEAHMIREAIESVRSIISETILVDTGSRDDTVQIARELGATVIEEPWQDDFALHRNTSIAPATGEWILVLDADERIAAGELQRLTELTLSPFVCWELTQRHYTDDPRISDFVPVHGEFPEFEKNVLGYFESSCVRLFPRHPSLTYRGRVHELVEHSIRDSAQFSIKRSGVRIHHLGHTAAVKQLKKKGRLYTPLGEQKTREQQDDFQAWFELGVEHNNNGKLPESYAAFSESLKRNPQYLSTWTNRGYVLCEMGKFTEAEADLKQALRLDPNCSEAYGNLGLVYFRGAKALTANPPEATKLLATAERILSRAVQISPHYLTALSNLGLVLATLKRFLEAAVVYQRILHQAPRHAAAAAELGGALLAGGNVAEGERYLRSAIEMNPGLTHAVLNLGSLLVNSGRKGEAQTMYRSCIAVQPVGSPYLEELSKRSQE